MTSEQIDAITPAQRRRFWGQVEIGTAGNCWNWKLKPHHGGYGKAKFGRTTYTASRVAYSLVYGAIQPGQIVRHRCDNPLCCNPTHLQLGDPASNARDMRDRGNVAGQKLSVGDVCAIRALRDAGASAAALASSYDVSPKTIYSIISRNTWHGV